MKDTQINNIIQLFNSIVIMKDVDNINLWLNSKNKKNKLK